VVKNPRSGGHWRCLTRTRELPFSAG
jgi:hypothetical protein